ncbi:ubiquinol-cytochrome C chaperone [Kaistia geumhonensis]|uniref:Cytochrome b pre-mRNA-processing protein 3 n=1 Tax=Kaistia geumhonensis TaxID=410839 RepID=A0ABU0M0H8_9HYPH|nr:ubiquinol-cytochrome C chaperone family protein [Kaistia geumhonensis]MCX5480307.1 ubiquinol-cytochrome C chaperone [Kaistia geumhonensis]MDQ0514460.1 cytochrome b pre-mRNA-processing protein 3 [Kaistia geumhonensis]
MFERLFARRRRNEAIAYALYGTIVAQARQPAFYAAYKVPDTLDGRFDMIVLHGFLLFHRLKGENEDNRRLGQEVFDIFLKDMDRSLRELGVSDIGVPKKLKKMAEAFYGRMAAYDSALSSGDLGALEAALTRNLFPDGGGEAVPRIAAYVVASAADLARQPLDRILAGSLSFPALPVPETA